jgi:hypothetical protein
MSKIVLLTCSEAPSLRNFRGRLNEKMMAEDYPVVPTVDGRPKALAL